MDESNPAVPFPEKRFLRRAILSLSVTALVLAEVLFVLGRASLRSPPPLDSGFRLLGRGQKSDSPKGFNTFHKEEREDGFALNYGWKDFAGRDCQAAFSLSKSLIAESEREFGYRQEELDLHLKAHSERLKLDMILSLRAFVQDRFA